MVNSEANLAIIDVITGDARNPKESDTPPFFITKINNLLDRFNRVSQT